MKVAIFLNTANAKKLSYPTLLAFSNGIKAHGDEILLIDQENKRHIPEPIPADVAVIYGYVPLEWTDETSGKTGMEARQKILDYYEKVICIDGGVFRSHGNNAFWRCGYGSPYYTGDFRNSGSPENRWKWMEKWLEDYTGNDCSIKPWKTEGEYILVCLQTSSGWSMAGMPTVDWCIDKVKQIRGITDMPIVIRRHRANSDNQVRMIMKGLQDYRGIRVEENKEVSPLQSINKAYALVTYNSTIACDSALSGVPTFVDDERCWAYPVANKDISRLLDPELFDRQQWVNDVSYSMWLNEEMEKGVVWEHLK